MSFEIIGDSLKSVIGNRAEEYHTFVYASGLIWAFSQKFHQQSTFNWGQRVVHKGGYAIAYNTKTNNWGEVIEFEPLTTDENVEELIFSINGQIFALLLTAFGQVAPLKLYSWSGNEWTEQELQIPIILPTIDPSSRVDAHIVDSSSTSDRYILFNADHSIRLFKFELTGNGASISFVKEVPAEVNVMRGKAISGVHVNGRVIISFMVLGCGYMWQKNRFIIYEEGTGDFKDVSLPANIAEIAPPFGFSGSAGHGVSPSGDWIHAGGVRQVGMTGSDFEGSIWALKNLEGDLFWERQKISIPAEIGGSSVIDPSSSFIYLVGDSVARASLN